MRVVHGRQEPSIELIEPGLGPSAYRDMVPKDRPILSSLLHGLMTLPRINVFWNHKGEAINIGHAGP